MVNVRERSLTCFLILSIPAGTGCGSHPLHFESRVPGPVYVSVQRDGEAMVDRRPLPATYRLAFTRKKALHWLLGTGAFLLVGSAIAGVAIETNGPKDYHVITIPVAGLGLLLAAPATIALASSGSNRYLIELEAPGQKTLRQDLRLPLPFRPEDWDGPRCIVGEPEGCNLQVEEGPAFLFDGERLIRR